MVAIAERYALIQERIAQTAQRAGRRAEEITLVAVSKTWPADVVVAAYQAGMRHFGENRVEELTEKRAAVEVILGQASGIAWHLIGALQSRKTSLAAAHADVFHALDRLKIAHRLSRLLVENGRVLPLFLEVNVSGEASKSGYVADNWENDATQRENLRKDVETIAVLPGLQLQGLMTMAPWAAEPEVVRSVFKRTRLLARWLETSSGLQLPVSATLTRLSMGMTDDFEIAIEEGATHIRVGRALFGSRQ
jgi:pyridoxal phosphate enzyme (YggS family)